jgi:hypothetical protein
VNPDLRERPEFLTGDNVFLAIGPCGCGYAIETCDDRDAQANVAEWRAEGGTVIQVPIADAKERLVLDCPHEPRYGLLPFREARAEVIRLRVENERLREALRPFAQMHCREWIGEDKFNHCNAPAEFVLWGKLFPADALGPRCYDHAAAHAGHRALGDPSWAIIDLRPARRAFDEGLASDG